MKRCRSVACAILMSAIPLLLIGCEGKIDTVKNSVIGADKARTIGHALDDFRHFESRAWSVSKNSSGTELVEFVGTLAPTAFAAQIQGELAEAEGRFRRTKKEMDIDHAKLEAGVNATIAKYASGCAGSENEAECIQGYLVNNPRAAQDRVAALARFESRKDALAGLERSAERMQALLPYVQANRFEVVYRFEVGKGKQVLIETGECRQVASPAAVARFDDSLSLLQLLLDNDAAQLFAGCSRLLGSN